MIPVTDAAKHESEREPFPDLDGCGMYSVEFDQFDCLVLRFAAPGTEAPGGRDGVFLTQLICMAPRLLKIEGRFSRGLPLLQKAEFVKLGNAAGIERNMIECTFSGARFKFEFGRFFVHRDVTEPAGAEDARECPE